VAIYSVLTWKELRDLPDVAVASRILNQGRDFSVSPGTGTPLLLESLQRMPELKKELPLPADFLDCGSM
jgi:hypothetical protein